MNKRNRKFQIEDLEITTVADQGVGMGRHNGKVIFVKYAIPGDVMDVQVFKNKSDYALASMIALKTPSALRVQPFCEHFFTCGGCIWQHVSYESQLLFKHQLVADAFRRIGKIPLPEIMPVIPSKFDRYYRNKLEFTFSNAGWIEDISDLSIKKEPALGFHIANQFAQVFDVKHCYLQPFPSNEIRKALKSYAVMHNLSFYDVRNHTGFLRNLIIRTTSVGEVMVIISFGDDKPDIIIPLLNHLQNTFHEITSLYYTLNSKVNDYLYDLDMILFSGNEFIIEQIGTIKYKLGPKSFFQTNSHQAETLYNTAIEFGDLQHEDVVYDFYTGLGSIALQIAAKCKKVIGVESIDDAVEDAKINATFNQITNTEFVSGDLARIFNTAFCEKYGKANVVITDPPRSGMHKDVCLGLLELAPEKIVYVSCNPATQARDIQLLAEKYNVEKMQPVDMFPQTYHIENVTLLIRKSE